MLASAPPPPDLAPPCHIGLHGWRPSLCAPPPPLVKTNPLALGKKSTSKKEKEKGLQPEKEKIDPLMHRERGALGSAAFKISPYKLGGRPLQGWRPGAMPPPCPPPPPLDTPLYLPTYLPLRPKFNPRTGQRPYV